MSLKLEISFSQYGWEAKVVQTPEAAAPGKSETFSPAEIAEFHYDIARALSTAFDKRNKRLAPKVSP